MKDVNLKRPFGKVRHPVRYLHVHGGSGRYFRINSGRVAVPHLSKPVEQELLCRTLEELMWEADRAGGDEV